MSSGKSTYDSQETKLLKRHKTKNVSRVKDVFTNYSPSDVMKGESNGLVAHVHVIVILSIQVVFLFALKRCYIRVWHTSQYFQNML